MVRRLLTAGLLPVLMTGVAPLQQDPGTLVLSATRFYSARQGTTVEAACRVPFGLLDLVEGGGGGFAAYRVTVIVRDSAGLALTEESWTQRVPARMRAIPGASAVEQFGFAVPAGHYAVEFAVTDSASGRTTRASSTVAGFPAPPLVSDLLLSTGIRPAADSGAVEEPGEFRRGGFFISAQPVPVLTPSQPMLYYYLELYPGRNVEASLAAHVRTSEGREIIATPAQPVAVHGAGVAATGLNLTGLPPGAYGLHVEFTFADTTVTRSAPFTMVGFDTEAAITSAFGQSADVFAPLTEDQLDTLYRPLIYVMESGERGVYEGLSVDGKRNYLRQFWARRDPTPDTPGNEFQDQTTGSSPAPTSGIARAGPPRSPDGGRTGAGSS